MGVTGSMGGPILSDHVYLTSSVLIMVQQAPSLIISLFDSLGHGVAVGVVGVVQTVEVWERVKCETVKVTDRNVGVKRFRTLRKSTPPMSLCVCV